MSLLKLRGHEPQTQTPVDRQLKRSRIDFGAVPRVDLLPASERDRRARRALTRRWVRIGIGAVVLAALIVAATVLLRMRADSALSAEQRRTDALLVELAQYQDIASAVASQRLLEADRARAMATDIDWGDVYAVLRSVLPAGASIEGLGLAPGAAPAGGQDLTGLVAVAQVESKNPSDLATVIDRLHALQPVTDVAMGLLEGPDDDDLYRYTVTVQFDQSVYSGRFASEGSQG